MYKTSQRKRLDMSFSICEVFSHELFKIDGASAHTALENMHATFFVVVIFKTFMTENEKKN